VHAHIPDSQKHLVSTGNVSPTFGWEWTVRRMIVSAGTFVNTIEQTKPTITTTLQRPSAEGSATIRRLEKLEENSLEHIPATTAEQLFYCRYFRSAIRPH